MKEKLFKVFSLGVETYGLMQEIVECEKMIDDINNELVEYITIKDESGNGYEKICYTVLANFFNNIYHGDFKRNIFIINKDERNEELFSNFEENCNYVAKDYSFGLSMLKDEEGFIIGARFIPNTKLIDQFLEELEKEEEVIQ